MKNVDSATPTLVQHVATGATFARARLTAVRSGEVPQKYLEFCFTNVAVSSLQESGGGDRPTESVSFTYQRFAQRYTPQTPTGAPGNPLFTGWDLVGNRTIGFQDVCPAG
jgi:type VI secretion system secreted protein Hcp